jgi:hypothetical protein
MEEKELKELLLETLHIELHLFKDSMLQKTKKEIYEASYKIEVYVNMYEILMEEVENLDIETVRGILHWKYGILELLYEEWLGHDDNSFDELKSYVGSELGVMAQGDISCRRESEDGEELNQAA